MAKDGDSAGGKARPVSPDDSLTGQYTAVGPHLRRLRRDGWTLARRRTFMETLAATANVTEAARVAGKNVSSAYFQRRRDPAFAREWEQALSVGYAELEALLLRQALFGTESVETIENEDGLVKSRKVKHAPASAIGLRLLLAHRRTVDALRGADMAGRPDGEDAMMRLRQAIDIVRARTKAETKGGEDI